MWSLCGLHSRTDVTRLRASAQILREAIGISCNRRRNAAAWNIRQHALGGVSGDHFQKAVKKGLAVRVEELSDDNLATILAFPTWLKAANAFVAALAEGGQEVGQEALNDVGRERTKVLFDQVSKWLAEPAEETPS